MASITQDMRYRLLLIRYAEKFGITKATIKYKTNRQYIYRCKCRYDGSIESLHALSDLITILTNTYLKKSSLSLTCIDVILIPILLSFGLNSCSVAISAPFWACIVSFVNKVL